MSWFERKVVEWCRSDPENAGRTLCGALGLNVFLVGMGLMFCAFNTGVMVGQSGVHRELEPVKINTRSGLSGL